MKIYIISTIFYFYLACDFYAEIDFGVHMSSAAKIISLLLSITKTNNFKVTKYKKVWWIFRPKWGKIKIFVIIVSLFIKNKNKDTHYKYT